MSLLSEFKEFAVKGNVVDMAVGIIVGAAFGKIVSSAVNDIIMPPIGLLLGGVNFSDLALVLKEAQGEVAAVTINYGVFIQTILDFIIVAFAIFVAIKAMNAAKRAREDEPEAAPEAPPEPSDEAKLLGEIRDLLAKQA
ncbi:MAG: large-conductance mechanosensitive channel protein MscL [Gammaproteobacteria bacterium]